MDIDELKGMIFDEDDDGNMVLADDIEDRIIPLGVAFLAGAVTKVYMNKRREELLRRKKLAQAKMNNRQRIRPPIQKEENPRSNPGKIIDVEYEVSE